MKVRDNSIPAQYFNSVCRICLREPTLLIPIEEISLTHNLNQQGSVKSTPLASILQKYCNVEVHINDKKPQKICETCMHAMGHVYNVLELFLESNNFLDGLLNEQAIRLSNPDIFLFTKDVTVLDELPSDIKIIISQENEDDSYETETLVNILEENDTECVQDESSKNALDLSFDTDFVNIDIVDHASDDNMETEVFVVEAKSCEAELDPSETLQDHCYSMNDQGVWRLSQGCTRKKFLRPVLSKTPSVPQFQRENERQNEIELPKDILKCRFCEIEFDSIENVWEHLKEEHSSTNRCILCPKVFSSYGFVVVHMASHSKEAMVCKRCHIFFKDRDSLQRHKESEEHKRPFNCHICRKSFVSLPRLKLHIDGVHNPNFKRLFQCSVCGFMFKWKHNLNKHMQCHKDMASRKRYLCQFCARSFVCAASLTYHVRRFHEGEVDLRQNIIRTVKKPKAFSKGLETFQCDICAKHFNRENFLFMHRLAHPEAAIKCLYCDKILKSPEKYKEHRKLEHMSFVCKVCQKRFPTNHLLHSHHSAQHSEKVHSCGECDATFKTPTLLNYHMLTHTGQRPFTCEYCGKGFKQLVHKVQHICCMHAEKKLKCKLCDKTFMFDSGLKNHLRSHSGEKPFICPYCGRDFRDTVVRHKHVKQNHPEEMEEFLIYKRQYQEEEIKQAKASCKTEDDILNAQLQEGKSKEEPYGDEPKQPEKVVIIKNRGFKSNLF